MRLTFDYRTVVTIGLTNAMTNVYFTEYFAMQGIVRELWVKQFIPNALSHFESGLILSTKSAHCDFKKPFFIFDTILCKMHVEDLRRVSVKLVFEFFKEEGLQLHATGSQVIVFKDRHRRTCRMPEEFKNAAHAIEWINTKYGELPNPGQPYLKH